MLTPRENIVKAMRRQEPQWIPFNIEFTPPVQKVFEEKTGAKDPAEYYQLDFRVARSGKFEVDTSIFLPYFSKEDGVTAETPIDIFGVASLRGSMYHFTKMVHPMAHLSKPQEIEEYPWPDVDAPRRQKEVARQIKAIHDRGLAAVPDMACIDIFERSWYMRGMQQLFIDMQTNPEFAEALLDKVTDMNATMAAAAARGGADFLKTGDDVATQRGMMMAPDFWRKWFKGRLAKVFKAAKDENPEILTWYHSDGDCRAIIPDLIEIGLDILNPVQPECMDPVALKKEYGDRLSFWGTIGTQTTMPFAAPDEVKAAVKRIIETVGRGGGLLLAPTHVLEPDVPWKNICAFVEAVREYGRKE